jgi:hypothetical protein
MGARVEVDADRLAAVFERLGPHLDERQRRLWAGAEAAAVGHGGIAAVARATGMRERTIARGLREVRAGAAPTGRVRAPGGGRKRLTQTDPGLVPALLALIEPDERGDPGSPLRWTTKSTRTLAGELTRQGHPVSAHTVADLLHGRGFSLQGNAKTIEGTQHPDRDGQFRYLNQQVTAHQDAGQPVVSVDTKKTEQVGQFANGGREWRPAWGPGAGGRSRLRRPHTAGRDGGPLRRLRPGREHRLGQRGDRSRHRRVRGGVAAPQRGAAPARPPTRAPPNC